MANGRHQAFSAERRFALFVLALSVLLTSAGCGESVGGRSLEFSFPEDEQVFSVDDDVDPEVAGVQIIVRAVSQGLAEESVVRLLQNDNFVEDQAAAEEMQFVVTLRRGINRFQILLDGEPRQEISVTYSDPCGLVHFVIPAVPDDGKALRLGGDAFCTTNQLDVVIVVPDVQDGTSITLIVNGQVQQELLAAQGYVWFEGVELSEHDNTIGVRIAADTAGGEACSVVEYPAPITVECGKPNCRIVAPAPGLDEALSSADDLSDEIGLQIDVEVTSDAAALGREVALFVNGNRDSVRNATANMVGDAVRAKFSSVDLANGTQSVRVECTDDLGNLAFDEVSWKVDVQPCGVEITSVSPEPGPGGVLAADAESIDVTLSVEIAGDDCAEMRIAIAGTDACATLASAAGTELKAGDEGPFNEDFTISSAGQVFLCASVTDASGNTAYTSVPVKFVNGGPMLSISLPPGETRSAEYNQYGTAGRIADLNPATTAVCEAGLVVGCLDPDGVPLDDVVVTLLQQGEPAVLATATCDNGTAVFDEAALPSVDGLVSYNLIARASANDIAGESAPFAVLPDCHPPTVLWSEPPVVCGATFQAGVDPDANGELEGYQITAKAFAADQTELTVYVQEPGDPRGSVSTTTSNASPPGDFTITDITLGAGGSYELLACTTDGAGNEACADDCEVVFSN